MAATLSTIGSGIDHPECVAWDPAGALVVGTEAGLLHWLDPADGEIRRTFEIGTGLVAGIALDGRGRAYACEMGQHRVVRVDPSTDTVEPYSTGPTEDPFRTPNYPVFDATGRLYVSDSRDWSEPNGLVAIVEPGGEARVGSRASAGYTNGLALSPDGAWLYVVESNPPLVSRLAVAGNGSLGQREVVISMPRHVPDGIAFASDGRLLVSCYRPDVVYVVEDGRLIVVAEDWSGITLSAPTNIAFGGPGLDHLYAANLSNYHVVLIDAGMTGAPLHYPDIP